MKLIKGNRRKLEREVLKTLISPAKSEEMDNAIAKLKPKGQLRVVSSKTNKETQKS